MESFICVTITNYLDFLGKSCEFTHFPGEMQTAPSSTPPAQQGGSFLRRVAHLEDDGKSQIRGDGLPFRGPRLPFRGFQDGGRHQCIQFRAYAFRYLDVPDGPVSVHLPESFLLRSARSKTRPLCSRNTQIMVSGSGNTTFCSRISIFQSERKRIKQHDYGVVSCCPSASPVSIRN